MHRDIEHLCVDRRARLIDVMQCVEKSKLGVALVIDEQRHLVDVVTDGDIRRAILKQADLSISVGEIIAGERAAGKASPITMPATASQADLIDAMVKNHIRHIPLIDSTGRVVGLEALESLISDVGSDTVGLVMAGGYGRRLAPLTDETPKPMLQVGGKPLIERIVEQLRDSGVSDLKITTHYRGDRIVDHFGDGARFGVNVEYVHEEKPLGTAGALGRINSSTRRILVVNGDILTRINFRAMVAFHVSNRASMTIAARIYELQVPFGVLSTEGIEVRGIVEKPIQRQFVSAGIYLLEPDALQFVEPNEPLHMPELTERLIKAGRRVVAFPVTEYWRDIGKPDDLERAREDVKAWVSEGNQ